MPVVSCPIDEQFLENMYETINPLAHSVNYGVDLFLATIDYVHMQCIIIESVGRDGPDCP